MATAWGIVLVVLGLLAWGGQTISWLAPGVAERWSLTEAEDSVEPVFWADIRGEALWDAFTLWTMVVAGALLLVDVTAWAHFGLVAGGIYVYFAGRGIAVRLQMRRRGYRIGEPDGVRVAYGALAVWGVVALITIVAAAVAL